MYKIGSLKTTKKKSVNLMHIDEFSYHIIEFVFTIIELLSFYAFKIK